MRGQVEEVEDFSTKRCSEVWSVEAGPVAAEVEAY